MTRKYVKSGKYKKKRTYVFKPLPFVQVTQGELMDPENGDMVRTERLPRDWKLRSYKNERERLRDMDTDDMLKARANIARAKIRLLIMKELA